MAGKESLGDSRKGIITCGNGDYRRQSWLTNHLRWNIGGRGSAVKGLEAQQCGAGLRGGNTEKKDMIEEEIFSVEEELNVNNGDERRGS